jgi:hypothetical protein
VEREPVATAAQVPKVYVADSGLLHTLLDIRTDPLA